jgi:hypothetical protein
MLPDSPHLGPCIARDHPEAPGTLGKAKALILYENEGNPSASTNYNPVKVN